MRERVLAGQPSLDEAEHDAAVDRRGTGYTEGVPYLNDVRALPVFPKAA